MTQPSDSATLIQAVELEIVVDPCTVFGLRIKNTFDVAVCKAVQPIECSVYFCVAKTRFRQFIPKFVLIGFWFFFFRVDVGFKQVHQHVEYVFFHAANFSSIRRTVRRAPLRRRLPAPE